MIHNVESRRFINDHEEHHEAENVLRIIEITHSDILNFNDNGIEPPQ